MDDNPLASGKVVNTSGILAVNYTQDENSGSLF